MTSPLISFFTNLASRRVVETVTPERTLADVVLPPQTRRTLDQALAQVRDHTLIFCRWGLGERHTSGRGLAFNFAGPPGTGKTICAEAIAHALGKKLLVVDYAEAESMWFGETPKNIVATFRAAAEQSAVIFFDEADAIATRRSAGAPMPHDRETNLTINVLMRELEGFNGIVIFATNLAADRKSTRLNSSHLGISYAVFCLKKKNTKYPPDSLEPQAPRSAACQDDIRPRERRARHS